MSTTAIPIPQDAALDPVSGTTVPNPGTVPVDTSLLTENRAKPVTPDQHPPVSFNPAATESRRPSLNFDEIPGHVEHLAPDTHHPLWRRLHDVAAEVSPNYSQKTVNDPTYGSMSIFGEPAKFFTPGEQREHPIATGVLETVGSLGTPGNVAMLAASGGLGELPGVAGKILPKLVSGLFSGSMVLNAYQSVPEIKAAVDRGDQPEAERLMTHLLIDSGMAYLAGKDAAELLPKESLALKYAREHGTTEKGAVSIKSKIPEQLKSKFGTTDYLNDGDATFILPTGEMLKPGEPPVRNKDIGFSHSDFGEPLGLDFRGVHKGSGGLAVRRDEDNLYVTLNEDQRPSQIQLETLRGVVGKTRAGRVVIDVTPKGSSISKNVFDSTFPHPEEVSDAIEGMRFKRPPKNLMYAREHGTTEKGAINPKPSYLENPRASRMRDEPVYKNDPARFAENYGSGQEWYHGTTSDFIDFKNKGIERGTTDWNSKLGTHFSEDSSVAQEFADGRYTGKSGGRVIPAKLKIQNPITYNFEGDMGDAALKSALKNKIVSLEEVKKVKPDFDPSETYHEGNGVINALRSKRNQIAANFKNDLTKQGYDGIIYGNVVEGDFGHKSVIAFDPKQIERQDLDFSKIPGHIEHPEPQPINPQEVADLEKELGRPVRPEDVNRIRAQQATEKNISEGLAGRRGDEASAIQEEHRAEMEKMPGLLPGKTVKTFRNDENPITFYRGESSGELFDKFDPKKTGGLFFFATVPEHASFYARLGSPVREFNLNADNVLDLRSVNYTDKKMMSFLKDFASDFENETDKESGEPYDVISAIENGTLYDFEGTGSGRAWRSLFRQAKNAGYDGVLANDITDHVRAPVAVVFNPEQIKPTTSGKPELPQDVSTHASKLGVEFRGFQEGAGKHPGLAIFQDPSSGTSVGVRRDELTPEKLQEHVDAARERLSKNSTLDFGNIPGHIEHGMTPVSTFDEVKHGSPVTIRAWHGTDHPTSVEREGFKVPESERNPLNKKIQAKLGGKEGFLGKGVYFTDSKAIAGNYGTELPVDVQLQKPYVIHKASLSDFANLDIDKLKEEGYDGIISQGGRYGLTGESYRQGIVFNPEQIKVNRDPFTATGFNKGGYVKDEAGRIGEIKSTREVRKEHQEYWPGASHILDVKWNDGTRDMNVNNSKVQLMKKVGRGKYEPIKP